MKTWRCASNRNPPVACLAASSILFLAGCGDSASPGGAGSGADGGSDVGPIRWLGAEVRFADVEQARSILGASDGFTQSQSAFDRGLRMRTEAPTSEADYLAYAAEQAREWPEALRRRWDGAARELSGALRGLELGLPEVIWLVQSTGAEDAAAPYTRQNAIILQGSEFDAGLLLAHELFHVASREDPLLAPSLYSHIGFSPIEDLPFPEELEARRITNPDAYHLDDVIRVQGPEGLRDVTPFLRSSLDLEMALLEERTLLSVVEVVLLEVDTETSSVIRTDDGDVSTFELDATDYETRAAVNTDYVLDSEEVLADNFALLFARCAGYDLADFGVDRPEVLDALETALEAR